jgi:hypothetical protein
MVVPRDVHFVLTCKSKRNAEKAQPNTLSAHHIKVLSRCGTAEHLPKVPYLPTSVGCVGRYSLGFTFLSQEWKQAFIEEIAD